MADTQLKFYTNDILKRPINEHFDKGWQCGMDKDDDISDAFTYAMSWCQPKIEYLGHASGLGASLLKDADRISLFTDKLERNPPLYIQQLGRISRPKSEVQDGNKKLLEMLQKTEVSDEFIYFCQHGKYPEPIIDPDAEAKAENQYIHDLKDEIKYLLFDADCSILTHDEGCLANHLNIYALLELAREIAPDADFISDVFDEVMDMYETEPQSIIDNQPR
jgi:hypothetical protein